jgi:hypothetical protein
MGHDPDAIHAEGLDVVESADCTAKVADAVAVAVLKGTDIELVKRGFLIPVSLGGVWGLEWGVGSGERRQI